MTSLTDLAARIATEAHKGQTRWDGETPYITHPATIARNLIAQGYDEDYVAVAWLHDVIEDTNITEKQLVEKGIPSFIARCVTLLSKKKDESYLNYLLRISEDDVARRVKIEDIKHNMSCFDKKSGSLYQKYELALYILEELNND